MLRHIAFVTSLSLAIPAATTDNQGMLGTSATSGMVFGDQYGTITILYSAPENTLEATHPFAMRMVVKEGCFYRQDPGSGMGRSIGELFAELTKDSAVKKRTLLEVARNLDPRDPGCAAIWFTYTEE